LGGRGRKILGGEMVKKGGKGGGGDGFLARGGEWKGHSKNLTPLLRISNSGHGVGNMRTVVRGGGPGTRAGTKQHENGMQHSLACPEGRGNGVFAKGKKRWSQKRGEPKNRKRDRQIKNGGVTHRQNRLMEWEIWGAGRLEKLWKWKPYVIRGRKNGAMKRLWVVSAYWGQVERGQGSLGDQIKTRGGGWRVVTKGVRGTLGGGSHFSTRGSAPCF